MNRKEILALCLIILALTVSFTTILYPTNSFSGVSTIQNSENTQLLATSLPMMLGVALHDNSTLLNQPTRLEIYSYVKNNPAVHFRGLCDTLDLSVGVVQYHLSVLVRAGLLKSYCDGQNIRYFVANAFRENDAKIVMLLRHQTAKDIISLLSGAGSLAHREISQKLGFSSQAISWQMNQLKKAGVVESVKEGVNVRYVLSQKNAFQITLLLSLYGNQKI